MLENQPAMDERCRITRLDQARHKPAEIGRRLGRYRGSNKGSGAVF